MKESAKATFDMKAEQKEKRERNEIPVSHASTMHDRWKSEPKGFMLGEDVGASQVDQPYISTCGDRLNRDAVSD